MDKVVKTEREWRLQLTPEQYRILREKGTERAYTGTYHDTKEPGIYRCSGCGTELFTSDEKFDSGCGWPSFYDTPNKEHVEFHDDYSHGMTRVEVTCAVCDGHLGHIFPDGPKDKTGMRYCINSAALTLESKDGLSDSNG